MVQRQKLIAFSAALIIVFATMLTDGRALGEIQRCERVTDPDIAFRLELCASHEGCHLVTASHDACVSTTGFLDRLFGRSGDDDGRLTNDDIAEALTPLDRPSGIRMYIERAREAVRVAFGGEPAQRVSAADGTYYEGSFDSNRTGVGVAIGRDGSVSRGQFNNGRLNGTGQTIEPSGAIAAGAFRENELSGAGATQSPEGEVVAGTFDNGHPVGMVEVTYPDGATQRVLYDDRGNELARGERAPRGQLAEDPVDPRTQQAQRNATAAAATPCATERAALEADGGDADAFHTQVVAGGLNTADADALRRTVDRYRTDPASDAGERYEQCLYQDRLRQLEATTQSAAATIPTANCQSMRQAALPELGATEEQRRTAEERMAQSISRASPTQLAETYQALNPNPNLPSDHRAADQYAQCLHAERLRQFDPNVDLQAVLRGEYRAPGAAPAGPDPWAAALPRNGANAGSAVLATSADAASRAARQRENAVLAERARQRVAERRNDFWGVVLQTAVTAAQVYIEAEAALAQQEAAIAAARAQAAAQAAAQAQARAAAQRQASQPNSSSDQCQGGAATYVDVQGFRLPCGTAN